MWLKRRRGRSADLALDEKVDENMKNIGFLGTGHSWAPQTAAALGSATYGAPRCVRNVPDDYHREGSEQSVIRRENS